MILETPDTDWLSAAWLALRFGDSTKRWAVVNPGMSQETEILTLLLQPGRLWLLVCVCLGLLLGFFDCLILVRDLLVRLWQAITGGLYVGGIHV